MPKRLLLVEDDDAHAFLVQEMLASADGESFAISRVANLAAARECVHHVQPDVLLLDLGLPDASGTDAVDTVRGFAPGLPIVVLTGLDDERLALQCIASGADDYLWKGEFRPNALRRAIFHAIARNEVARDRDHLHRKLEAVLARVLSGFVPICAGCKRIREGETWTEIERFVMERSELVFTHGFCPTCAEKYFPRIDTEDANATREL